MTYMSAQERDAWNVRTLSDLQAWELPFALDAVWESLCACGDTDPNVRGFLQRVEGSYYFLRPPAGVRDHVAGEGECRRVLAALRTRLRVRLEATESTGGEP